MKIRDEWSKSNKKLFGYLCIKHNFAEYKVGNKVVDKQYGIFGKYGAIFNVMGDREHVHVCFANFRKANEYYKLVGSPKRLIEGEESYVQVSKDEIPYFFKHLRLVKQRPTMLKLANILFRS